MLVKHGYLVCSWNFSILLPLKIITRVTLLVAIKWTQKRKYVEFGCFFSLHLLLWGPSAPNSSSTLQTAQEMTRPDFPSIFVFFSLFLLIEQWNIIICCCCCSYLNFLIGFIELFKLIITMIKSKNVKGKKILLMHLCTIHYLFFVNLYVSIACSSFFYCVLWANVVAKHFW